jgi:hypothetical protein
MRILVTFLLTFALFATIATSISKEVDIYEIIDEDKYGILIAKEMKPMPRK